MASSVDCHHRDSWAVRPTVGFSVAQVGRGAALAVAPWAAPVDEAAVATAVSFAQAERVVQLADAADLPAVRVEQPSRAAVAAGAEPQVAVAAEAAALLPAGAAHFELQVAAGCAPRVNSGFAAARPRVASAGS